MLESWSKQVVCILSRHLVESTHDLDYAKNRVEEELPCRPRADFTHMSFYHPDANILVPSDTVSLPESAVSTTKSSAGFSEAPQQQRWEPSPRELEDYAIFEVLPRCLTLPPRRRISVAAVLHGLFHNPKTLTHSFPSL